MNDVVQAEVHLALPDTRDSRLVAAEALGLFGGQPEWPGFPQINGNAPSSRVSHGITASLSSGPAH